MATDQEQHIEIPIDMQLGIYNAVQPTSLPKGGYLLKKNAYMNKLGSNAKRPGSAPVTSAALAATIQYLTEYRATSATGSLLAASGNTLYKYDGASTLTAQTMTNALVKSDIYTVAFKNLALTSILFITDGGSVKKYDGTAVANIPPAPDDVAPAPPNNLASINTQLPIYCWTYKGHLFISIGDDSAWHSKLGQFDYYPTTFTTRYVRNNDYLTGCGVTFGDICLLPMRRGWGVTTYNSSVSTLMIGNNFLNTVNGNISPRAIQKITYPDGSQTVAYLSDDGVYEIYDTGFIDSSGSGSRNYATRPLMKDKVDFSSYGFTEAEKIAAEAYFDSVTNMYILTIKRGAVNYAFVYDVRNREWTGLWENIRADSTIRFNNILYYAGTTKLLHKYDETLGTDYDDQARTIQTDVDWDNFTGLYALESTGYQSYLDYLIVWAKNFSTKSGIDVTVITFNSTQEYLNAVRSQYMTWGVTNWGEAVWANLDFTTQVGVPPRLVVKKRSFYFQLRFRNPRNELVEMYQYKILGRTSGN